MLELWSETQCPSKATLPVALSLSGRQLAVFLDTERKDSSNMHGFPGDRASLQPWSYFFTGPRIQHRMFHNFPTLCRVRRGPSGSSSPPKSGNLWLRAQVPYAHFYPGGRPAQLRRSSPSFWEHCHQARRWCRLPHDSRRPRRKGHPRSAGSQGHIECGKGRTLRGINREKAAVAVALESSPMPFFPRAVAIFLALSPRSLMEGLFCLLFTSLHAAGQRSPGREVLCDRATRLISYPF